MHAKGLGDDGKPCRLLNRTLMVAEPLHASGWKAEIKGMRGRMGVLERVTRP